MVKRGGTCAREGGWRRRRKGQQRKRGKKEGVKDKDKKESDGVSLLTLRR